MLSEFFIIDDTLVGGDPGPLPPPPGYAYVTLSSDAASDDYKLRHFASL